jgi:hypothetical protein
VSLPPPSSFAITLNDGASLDLTIVPSPRGPVVRAEERVDGVVVGRIEASQQALQRALGLVQRAQQPENAGRDRTA